MRYLSIIVSITLLLGGCSSRSTDIGGHFSGTVPCASCPGIEVELDLDNSQTYTLKTIYVGHPELDRQSKGIWFVDKKNYIVELVDDQKKYYIIYDDLLELLDKNGNRSKLGVHYRLEQ